MYVFVFSRVYFHEAFAVYKLILFCIKNTSITIIILTVNYSKFY